MPYATCNRLSSQPEFAVPRLSAVVRESEKVKRFRAIDHTALRTIRTRKPPELDQSGLFGMKFQCKIIQTTLKVFEESCRIALILKTYHKIVRIAYDHCFSDRFMLSPLPMKPQVKNVMQVNVGEDR